MLRQRRLSQRASLGQSLNLYANENIMMLSSTQDTNLNMFSHAEPKKLPTKSRIGLSEVDKNSNKCVDITESRCGSHFGKINQFPMRDHHEQKYRNQDKDAIFSKISFVGLTSLPIFLSFVNKLNCIWK